MDKKMETRIQGLGLEWNGMEWKGKWEILFRI